MSRIGRAPISLPSNVEVTLGEGNLVTVKGPKGTLTQKLSEKMTLTQEGNVIHVTRPNDEKENRALHGLTRTLLNNMVVGVTEGYKKELDVNGVGKLVEMACKLGRQTNPDLELGICGEHGGDPSSIAFCHKVGLDYVSCSPFRVPIARLAAAQAAIREEQ